MRKSPARPAALMLVLTAAVVLVHPHPPHAAETEPGDYEMTTYYVGFLYRGAKWTPERTPETEKIQAAHLANIERLVESGELLLAGPFADDGDLRGMFVFRVDSMEEARRLCDTDPAVKAGRLKVEVHPWYSARGIHIDPHPGEHD